jgi:vacuolar-type H+-ATPase subunit I/STV1
MFLELGGVKDGHFPPISIPLIMVGTILNLSIEGLIVMVHVLRLHWVELLPKFYSGKGTPFKPIMIK